ncbi:ferric reduction oxidase 6 [Nicotiana attenuata]|uniref:ferric-chelate reductase (NADH) n=1 Tax=Nicotiana attenuata TaxID=49451 RepID=A0A1J6K382_NICAT|nr:ferric reduction oxidase 6 [Nicotiana attenuata]
MGEFSGQEPLLLKKENDFDYLNKTPLWISSTKFILNVLMWVIFIAWATFLFLLPSAYMNELQKKLIRDTQGTIFGKTGSKFLMFSFPIFMIAFLAIIRLVLSGKDEPQVKKTSNKGPSFRLWTFPVLVDGPFGVVTAAEMIGVVLFSVYIIWAVIMYSIRSVDRLSSFHVQDMKEKSGMLLELTGRRFGFIGLTCLAFLFIPVARVTKTVAILSATCFPCGTIELVLSKPANLHYNALGWIFLQIGELSWLQWHPFSVSSSPLDGKHHLAILIKVLGDWTEKLKGHILNLSVEQPEMEPLLQHNRILTASVEGPYGHESPYYLTYENLILVAGGIGISPFLAILSDILHRLNDSRPCLPRNILIVWAIKHSDELPLLETIDMEAICPLYSDKLNLEIQTFVTRESQPSLEEGKRPRAMHTSISPGFTECRMSSLVGTGNVVWSGLYVIVSTIGLVITVALLDIFYINPFNVTYWWYKGLLLIGCMAASVVVFGGLMIALWHLWERKTSLKEEPEDNTKKADILQQNEASLHKNVEEARSVNTIRYGERPDFQEIFGSHAESWGSVDIGLIVCGPPTLQSSVANECRRQNLQRRGHQAIFHFNSHSFDL